MIGCFYLGARSMLEGDETKQASGPESSNIHIRQGQPIPWATDLKYIVGGILVLGAFFGAAAAGIHSAPAVCEVALQVACLSCQCEYGGGDAD